MKLFSETEINNIEQMWRALGGDHPWTGWATLPENPDEIWIFRSRANWRRFILRKTDAAYVLFDDTQNSEEVFEELESLANKVGQVPALPN
ncbi:RNA-binding protein [Hirschia baltica]|uniref:Uncharacterized protein n=1 Tax=Hirschia baltica (strain ATCC 49814 / DSM 5838 / IFAM 1418) TaxID=582402 RepID=C6XMT1_HIRBI|nr:hypothetical protein [Hirschia baltica]ACT59995.1 hypothetical protein Hbal_2315 [Hirschia baltica ATCC 49814]